MSIDYGYAMTALAFLCQVFVGLVALPKPSRWCPLLCKIHGVSTPRPSRRTEGPETGSSLDRGGTDTRVCTNKDNRNNGDYDGDGRDDSIIHGVAAGSDGTDGGGGDNNLPAAARGGWRRSWARSGRNSGGGPGGQEGMGSPDPQNRDGNQSRPRVDSRTSSSPTPVEVSGLNWGRGRDGKPPRGGLELGMIRTAICDPV